MELCQGRKVNQKEHVWCKFLLVAVDATGIEDQSVLAAGPTTALSLGKESEAFPSP